MKQNLKKYLFGKAILVNNEVSENCFSALLALAGKFGIQVVSGKELAHEDMILDVSEFLGEKPPLPFYRGFPNSVRKLCAEQLYFDQLLHYYSGSVPELVAAYDHSVFEDDIRRLAFKEKHTPKEFAILRESEAVETLAAYVEELLKSARPLSKERYEVVLTYLTEYGYHVQNCACKDTAISLLLDTGDFTLTNYLSMSDVIRFVEILNYRNHEARSIRKLNLTNAERKLVTKVMDCIYSNAGCSLTECYEKKAQWCGLLHHIHYRAKNAEMQNFTDSMRGRGNQSVYAAFEKIMASGDVRSAADCLRNGKGPGAVLRHLNYLVSRCKTEEDIAYILRISDTKKPILLIQVLMQLSLQSKEKARSFRFARFGLLKVHHESEEEDAKRQSRLTDVQTELLKRVIFDQLRNLLKGKLGRVYISPEMYDISLPLQESTSQGGYGVLPRGTVIPLEQGKKLRAFVYWEGVRDIDLSVMGIGYDGKQYEYSWRTMFYNQTECITFSGDQVNGLKGGSEYFDVHIAQFKEEFPHIRYLIFNANVYSRKPFDRCTCRAGYMLRDIHDTGEVFEAKTVKSAFAVDCKGIFADLFGIDLEKNHFVWLNIARNSNTIVAGQNDFSFFEEYFHANTVMNVGKFYELLSNEVVDTPEDADVVLSDEICEIKEGAEQIHSYDAEKIMAFLK